jgi:hypothetical protein
MNTKITQYSSSQTNVVSRLEWTWFAYELSPNQSWVTSVNRVRKFLEQTFEISAISRVLIFSLLEESWGEVLGEWIDTNMNRCTLVFCDPSSFKIRVEIALSMWEIRKK